MATLAKHLQIARTRGVEAGLEAYLNAPSSQRHPAYKTITRKRSEQGRLDAYCKAFADKLGKINPRVPAVQEKLTGDVQAIIEQAVQQALAGVVQGGSNTEDAEVEALMESFEVSREVAEKMYNAGLRAEGGGQQVAAPSKNNSGTDVEFLTSGEAWEALIALGDDPDFPAPQNPERPATNGQLFRLNTVHGALSINLPA